MKPRKEFDEFFEEMKDVERSEEAKRNTWLALKDRIETKRKRNIFPAFISLAIIAIASFLFITISNPSETEQSAKPLSNEKVIKAVLEREYNGPDEEYLRLMNNWMDLQSETKTENQEQYNQLLQSKEYTDLMDYFPNTFGEYFSEGVLTSLINTNLVFKYDYFLENKDIEMHLENVEIKPEKDHPNIYHPVIEVSLTNSQGQKIFHTFREEFIFSTSEPGKIGRYNGVKGSGGMELLEKIKNFNAYVGGNEDVRTPTFRESVSFDTLCFNGKIYENDNTSRNLHGCTSARNQINSILATIDHLPIKEASEQESRERAEALPQMDNYHLYLTNEVDKGTILYTITLYKDGMLMFSPGDDFGFLGDITTEPHVVIYEEIKRMIGEFAEN
ncbi:hypothetical protein PB01_14665 [Psychrobacillus glaciei]|uniref:Uncharacterized protein n=1 Tax=Psychrobacillus glaciei TaxID=2283160 RepID=A0A5J6SST6_9BACI|nr:hypothetical protein [Psychrobacillus glaciei]QFF99964.1 hypothetical protein PB01_14665 [Psychrobacillus glaciei]